MLDFAVFSEPCPLAIGLREFKSNKASTKEKRKEEHRIEDGRATRPLKLSSGLPNKTLDHPGGGRHHLV